MNCSVLTYLLVLVLAAGNVLSQDPAADSTLSDSLAIDSFIEDSATIKQRPLIVSVERVLVEDMKLDDTLEVFLESFGKPVAGFDLKLGMAGRMVDILEVLPGEIHDSCRWEFFNARRINTEGKERFPQILWQIVALAEVMPDSTRPVCFGLDRRASLLRLVVSNEHIRWMPDTAVALFFFWEDCTDNTLADITGDTLAMSIQVVDYFPADDYEGEGLFPTRQGAPNQCIDPATRNRPQRRVEFHNGGIEFKLNVGVDSSGVDDKAGE